MSTGPQCYCYNCSRTIGSKGIMNHRAMHRRRKERVEIRFSTGLSYEYDYRDLEPQDSE